MTRFIARSLTFLACLACGCNASPHQAPVNDVDALVENVDALHENLDALHDNLDLTGSSSAIDLAKCTVTVDRAMGVAADGKDMATVSVVVRDASGAGIGGLSITISATGDGNMLTQPMVTDGGGLASGTIASSVAGTKTLGVRVTQGGKEFTLLQMPTVVFVAVGPGSPSAVTSTLVADPATVAADGVEKSTLTLVVKDINGAVLAGQTVTITASGSDNVIDPAGGITDAGGRFLSTISSRRAEVKTVTATMGGITKQTMVTFVNGVPSAMTSSLLPQSRRAWRRTESRPRCSRRSSRTGSAIPSPARR